MLSDTNFQAAKIRKPLLEITYQEKRTSLIDSTTTVPAIYFMDYYQGATAYETGLRWGLGGACALPGSPSSSEDIKCGKLTKSL